MLLNDEEKEIAYNYWTRQLKTNCPICGGTGYTTINNNGYKQAKTCSCEHNIKMNILLEDFGLPRKFLHPKWNLELIKDKTYYSVISEYINNFQNHYDNAHGLFLTGGHGRGKSTIECIIAKEIAKKKNADTNKYFSVAFSLYEDLINLKFDTTKQTILNQILYNTSLLIIDNIGNETGRNDNRFSQRFLETILRKRDNLCLPTILSSNDSLQDIYNKYGEDVHDFIQLNCTTQFFSGTNHRKQSQQGDNDLWQN